MILYVETNFTLELARRQEQAKPAEQLLRFAERERLALAFPIFSVCESFSTLTYYAAERTRFVDSMQRQLRELFRSEPHRQLASLLQPLGQTLLSMRRDETQRLETIVQRMLATGRSLPLTQTSFRSTRQLQRVFGFSVQDAIVYASILSDLQRQPRRELKCFVSRNTKDFDDPAIHAQLARYNCRYIARFDQAVDYVTSHTVRRSKRR